MMVKNNSLLLEMIKDMSEAEDKYRPDNYWMFYIDKIVKQLKNNDLNEFRNLNGGGGSGSIAVYSGGSKEFYTYQFGWNFHPLEDDFKKFDNNFIVKKFNRLIDKLSIYFSPIKFLSFRSAITRIYYEAAVQRIQNLVYDNVALLDKNKLLEKIQDSKIGNPNGFIKNGRFYTTQFLNEVLQILFIEKHTKLQDIDSVVEIGSGMGLTATTFLQVNPKIKYFLIDIPPALYIAQKYLIANNYKVLTYEELKRMENKDLKNINLKNYNAVCLAPWMMNSIKNLNFDMFINIASFQEMGPEIVQNYINTLSPKINKIIYLHNENDGKGLGEERKFGVLKQTTRKDYINFLSPYFDLVKERDSFRNKNSSEQVFERKS